MARRKKNDFWDDVDDNELIAEHSGDNHKTITEDDEDWSVAKSLPLKVIMRFLLMVACLVALGSAYIAYEYVGDRYAGGSYSTDFYNSGTFAGEFNKSMDQLLQLVQAMEADPSVTEAGNEELLTTLVENYMGKDTNFSFIIQDSDNYLIASSGDDAKDRIEASNHYVLVSNVDGETTVKSPISGQLLDKDEWNKTLSETTNTYIIYSAVDNELTQVDAYSKANQEFEKMEGYFNIARFVGIIAAVIFVLCLIFCIMSTGMKKGCEGVCLSWFDKIYTEFALVIMAGGAVGLIVAIRKLMAMEGTVYGYGAVALVVVAYGWIIRSYFSIVRRIKAGTLFKSSIIGKIVGGIAGAIGKLPSPLNIIVGALILIVINGALVYGVIFMRQYTVKGIPVMFIVAPVVFIIELLALLMHGGDNEEEDAEETSAETEDAAVEEEKSETAAVSENVWPDGTDAAGTSGDAEDPMDWESMDLGKAIAAVEQSRAQQNLTVDSETAPVADEPKRVGQKTEILSVADVEKALRDSGFTPQIEGMEEVAAAEETVPDVQVQEKAEAEAVKLADDIVKEETIVQTIVRKPEPVEETDDGRVNFVQLNKDVRKEFKAALKNRGIGVTVRAPEKPIIIDIDRNSLHIIISDIFRQIERLSANDARTYVEVYLQGGKVVYIVRIPVAESMLAEASKAAAGDSSFEAARKIIEANDGKFIVTLDGSELKAGMLIDAAQ